MSTTNPGKSSASLPKPDAPSTYVAWTVYSPERAKIRKRSFDGSLRQVEFLSDPIPTEDAGLNGATVLVVIGDDKA